MENRSTYCEILSISYAVSIVVLPADTAAVNRRGDPPVVNTSLSYLVRKVWKNITRFITVVDSK